MTRRRQVGATLVEAVSGLPRWRPEMDAALGYLGNQRGEPRTVAEVAEAIGCSARVTIAALRDLGRLSAVEKPYGRDAYRASDRGRGIIAANPRRFGR